jgi:hypothetical protein
MAKNTENIKKFKIKIRRKGRHAKTKMSSLKSSKNYFKKNKGQG